MGQNASRRSKHDTIGANGVKQDKRKKGPSRVKCGQIGPNRDKWGQMGLNQVIRYLFPLIHYLFFKMEQKAARRCKTGLNGNGNGKWGKQGQTR